MTLTKYQKMSYKMFGNFVKKNANEKLRRDLQSAHINLRAEAYISFAILITILGTIVTFIVMTILLLLIFPILGITLDIFFTILFLLIPFIVGLLIFITYLEVPRMIAKSRCKKIDRNLPYALNFISAMASAGVTPTEIFKSLSKQDIYGEIKEESSWIYRDVSLLGSDIITSIKDNITRSPSDKFSEFLQGLVVTVTSGGSLKSYFIAKANQFMVENRQKQKQGIESLGIIAESYVTAAVAGILLLFIIIPIMMIISGDYGQFTFLYLIIFTILPLVHFGFAFIIRGMSQEV